MIVAVVLAVLAAVAVAALTSGETDAARLDIGGGTSVGGVFQAAGLLFFAFAGYARIATSAKRSATPPVRSPVPSRWRSASRWPSTPSWRCRAERAGPAALADADRAALGRRAGGGGGLAGAGGSCRRGGGGARSLLALILGVSRTTLAMARDRHLPHALAAVHPRFKVPHRAELLMGVVVAMLAATADVRGAIGFSSFAVLVYYAIANTSAFTLGPDEGSPCRPIPVVGLAGCVVLAFALPASSVISGAAVLAAGIAAYAVRRRIAARRTRRAASRGS